jgi:glycosyltransferase involved in cell wall biosynthesis
MQNYDDYEIIVVDNASTDKTKDIVHNLSRENNNIKYVYEAKQGVHFARNTGALLSKYDFLYFTDDDMIADPDLLKNIIIPFKLNPSVVVVTGKILPIWFGKNPPNWILKYCQNHLLSVMDDGDDISFSKIPNRIFSCHECIRKSVLIDVEGFNPEYTFNMYLGDGESGLHRKIVNKNKYLFAYNGLSTTFHKITPDRLTQSYINKRLYNNGRGHAYSTIHFNLTNNNHFFHYIKQGIKYNFTLIFNSIILLIKNRDINYFRIFLANIFCLFGYNRFIIDYFTDKKFNKFVKKTDWLSNPNF